jgi:hypothetical protein
MATVWPLRSVNLVSISLTKRIGHELTPMVLSPFFRTSLGLMVASIRSSVFTTGMTDSLTPVSR